MKKKNINKKNCPQKFYNNNLKKNYNKHLNRSNTKQMRPFKKFKPSKNNNKTIYNLRINRNKSKLINNRKNKNKLYII